MIFEVFHEEEHLTQTGVLTHRTMGPFPPRLDPRVRIVPIGREWDEVCTLIGDAVEDEFGFAVERGDPLTSPDDRYATPYLRRVEDEIEANPTFTIGVTDDKLEMTLPTRDVGSSTISLLGGNTSLISTYPYRNSDTSNSGETAAWFRRCTLVVIGRNFGMDHEAGADEDEAPRELTCVNEIDAVDPGNTVDLPDEYCDDCQGVYIRTKPVRLRRYPPRDRLPLDASRRLLYSWQLLLSGLIAFVRGVLRIPTAIKRLFPAIPSGIRAAPRSITRHVPRSPRDFPGWFHTLHRVVGFWLRLGMYGVAMVVWAILLNWGHQHFVGGDLGTTAGWAVGLSSIFLGILSVWVVSAIVVGFYAGLRGKDPDAVFD